MKFPNTRFGIVALGVLLLPADAPAQTLVTTCGQTVSDDGVLTADLDCTGSAPAITLTENTQFKLSGYTFTGPVRCSGVCFVAGPGTLNGDITGDPDVDIFVGDGIAMHGDMTTDAAASVISQGTVYGTVTGDEVYVLSATVRESPGSGVIGNFVGMIDGTVTQNTGNGVECTSCELYLSQVGNNGGNGVMCNRPLVDPKRGKAYLYSTQVENNDGHGIDCLKSVTIDGGWSRGSGGTNVHVLGGEKNGGPRWGKVTASNAAIDFGDVGIETLRTKLTNVTVTNNDTDGIRATKITLKSSHAVSNRLSVDCGVSESCVDLRSVKKPRVDDMSSCERSDDTHGVSWEVCSLD